MRTLLLFVLVVAQFSKAGASKVCVGIEYDGFEQDGIEHFLGIKFGHDTSGPNRFKPPRLYVPPPGTKIDGSKPGPACPQPLGVYSPPLGMGNITGASEDCLNLNIARPKLNGTTEKMPVMVWIHGGSFWYGSNMEPTTAPDGLIHQSVLNGMPVIYVRLNYRLGFFGFAQSSTLKVEGSMNAGLRDQRLGIEWVRDNIALFGGDPERITILGQSSGGLAVGMQIMAYGGSKPLPFARGSAQSQSLEPGITKNFSIDAMTVMADAVGCNVTDVHSPETITCLRAKDTGTLLNASIATYASDIAHNIGDIWLPAVDDDFLPASPSQLLAEGRFGNATFMTGYTDGDLNFYTNVTIDTAERTYDFIHTYLPSLSKAQLSALLALYPIKEFTPPPDSTLTPEFYRSARIFRDILMVCPSLLYGAAMSKTHDTPIYHYDFNQTIVDKLEDRQLNVTGLGVGHTSEFAYVFDSFGAYNVTPSEADKALMRRTSRSWSSFAATGDPKGGQRRMTLRSWNEAWEEEKGPAIMTIGGSREGSSPAGGVVEQRLEERCGFLNDPEIIEALGY